MSELKCNYCGQVLENAGQLHDITHCAKYAIETTIPKLEDDLSALRASVKEAVEEIKTMWMCQVKEGIVGLVYRKDLMTILESHGLVEAK